MFPGTRGLCIFRRAVLFLTSLSCATLSFSSAPLAATPSVPPPSVDAPDALRSGNLLRLERRSGYVKPIGFIDRVGCGLKRLNWMLLELHVGLNPFSVRPSRNSQCAEQQAHASNSYHKHWLTSARWPSIFVPSGILKPPLWPNPSGVLAKWCVNFGITSVLSANSETSMLCVYPHRD